VLRLTVIKTKVNKVSSSKEADIVVTSLPSLIAELPPSYRRWFRVQYKTVVEVVDLVFVSSLNDIDADADIDADTSPIVDVAAHCCWSREKLFTRLKTSDLVNFFPFLHYLSCYLTLYIIFFLLLLTLTLTSDCSLGIGCPVGLADVLARFT